MCNVIVQQQRLKRSPVEEAIELGKAIIYQF